MACSAESVRAPALGRALSSRETGGFLLDPRAKLVLVFCFGMVYYEAVDIGIWLEVLGCACSLVLLASAGRLRAVGGFCCFFAFTYLMQFTAIPLLGSESMAGLVFSMIFVVFRKFVPPFIMLMYLVLSTQTAHLISALLKMHAPLGLATALAVLFRFFPTVSEQFQAIRSAMKLKGIPLTFRNFFSHPLRTFEYCIVPLMSSSLKIGSELSCAALCRGLGYRDHKTSLVEAKLRAADYLCIGISIGISVLFMIWKHA